MTDGIIFTKKTKDLIIKTAYSGIKVPFWLKPFIKPGIRIALNFIEKQGDKIIPDNIDGLINGAITETINGNYDKASEYAGTALNIVIDIPLMNEQTEQTMFTDGIRLIIRIIQNWIEKKRK
jgi:hypothetical protein